jgi:hypothetical protein
MVGSLFRITIGLYQSLIVSENHRFKRVAPCVHRRACTCEYILYSALTNTHFPGNPLIGKTGVIEFYSHSLYFSFRKDGSPFTAHDAPRLSRLWPIIVRIPLSPWLATWEHWRRGV